MLLFLLLHEQFWYNIHLNSIKLLPKKKDVALFCVKNCQVSVRSVSGRRSVSPVCPLIESGKNLPVVLGWMDSGGNF